MLTWFLLAKIVVSASVVLSISAIAEFVNPRVAGVLAGAPLSAPIILLFVGHDLGIDFAVMTVPSGIASFTATVAFAFAYERVSAWQTATRRPLANALLTTLFATIVFLIVGWGVTVLNLGLPASLAMSITTIVVVTLLMSPMDGRVKVARIRFGGHVLASRAAIAALFVVSATGVAEIVGPVWAGIVLGFPITVLPVLLILHVTYGRDHARNAIRGFPVGLGGVLSYLVLVPVTFPAHGVGLGTALAVAGGIFYMIVLNIVRGRLAARGKGSNMTPGSAPP